MLALLIQVAAMPPSPPGGTQAELDAISSTCRTPRGWLSSEGGEVVIRADPDADFKKLECVLRKVSAILPPTSIAIIGNAPAPEKK